MERYTMTLEQIHTELAVHIEQAVGYPWEDALIAAYDQLAKASSIIGTFDPELFRADGINAAKEAARGE